MTAIEALLEQTVVELRLFLAAIDKERKILISGDIDQLPGIADEKSVLATRLANMEAQRDASLAAAGFGSGRNGIDAWLASKTAGGIPATQQVWQTYIDLAATAKRENKVNGKLIGARLQQNQQALATLLGKPVDSTIYGADGQPKAAAGRRPLGSA